MVRIVANYVKILLLLLLDLLIRIKKIGKYLWTRKHEVVRICESNYDFYEKTTRVDRWLAGSKCKPIQIFMNIHFGPNSSPASSLAQRAIERILKHYRGTDSLLKPSDQKSKNSHKIFSPEQIVNLEDGDSILESTLQELTTDLVLIIAKEKHLTMATFQSKDCLRDIIYRILCYKLSIMLTEQLASTKYNSDLDSHIDKLISLWNNLIQADRQERQNSNLNDSKAFPLELSNKIEDEDEIVSSRWSHIGFQGEDPGTDFRGMGLLGLVQLEYISRKPNHLACDLLKRSLNETHSYPFAIVGINITFNLLNLFKDGYMKHLYYDTGDVLFRNQGRALPLLKTFNDLYVELYLRFDCFWHESKPATIFEFKPLMEKFVNIIRVDLCNRNFSLKFIY